MSHILAKIDAMLAQLRDRAVHADRVSEITTTITKLKTLQANQAIAALPMKDGAVDAAEWGKHSKIDQSRTWATLTGFHKELRCMNAPALQRGTVYCGIFAALLLAMAITYLCLHRANPHTALYTPLPPQQIVDITKTAHLIELQLAALKATQNKNQAEQSAPALPTASKQSQTRTTPRLPAEAVKATPQPSTDLSPDQKKPTLAEQFTEFGKTLTPLPLSHETMRLFGTTAAEQEAGDITLHLTYQQFLKYLRADLERLSTAYFWTTHPWRWAELSLWATLGCLVGLLFYIAGLLKQGVFYPEEIPMFWAELLMAPIVVPVVFFLFSLSGISELSPSESSITTNIGVAFIFGFAIRRTIGVLDLIKKRFFPDPTP